MDTAIDTGSEQPRYEASAWWIVCDGSCVSRELDELSWYHACSAGLDQVLHRCLLEDNHLRLETS